MPRNVTSRLMGDAAYDEAVERYPNIMARLRVSERAETSEPAAATPVARPAVDPDPPPGAEQAADSPPAVSASTPRPPEGNPEVIQRGRAE